MWQMLTKKGKLIGLTILTGFYPGKSFIPIENVINYVFKNIDPIFCI